MQSFSQHGQDILVFETFFKSRTDKGFFVDVGAYDGLTFSNSLFFERHLGWSGICIEPLPIAFAQLRATRKALCLDCAVSDVDSVADFIDVDVPGFGKTYSGLTDNYDPRHIELLDQHAVNARPLQVRVRRMNDILGENGVQSIDYLSIDTEGSELKIIQAMDFVRFPTRVISIENNYEDQRIREHLTGLGFSLIKVFAGFDELYAR